MSSDADLRQSCEINVQWGLKSHRDKFWTDGKKVEKTLKKLRGKENEEGGGGNGVSLGALKSRRNISHCGQQV